MVSQSATFTGGPKDGQVSDIPPTADGSTPTKLFVAADCIPGARYSGRPYTPVAIYRRAADGSFEYIGDKE